MILAFFELHPLSIMLPNSNCSFPKKTIRRRQISRNYFHGSSYSSSECLNGIHVSLKPKHHDVVMTGPGDEKGGFFSTAR